MAEYPMKSETMITAEQVTDYRATANSILADDCDPESTLAAEMIITLCHVIDALCADNGSMRDAVINLIDANNAEDSGAFLTALNAIEERVLKAVTK